MENGDLLVGMEVMEDIEMGTGGMVESLTNQPTRGKRPTIQGGAHHGAKDGAAVHTNRQTNRQNRQNVSSEKFSLLQYNFFVMCLNLNALHPLLHLISAVTPKTYYPTYYEPPVPKPTPRPTPKPVQQIPTVQPTDGSNMRLIQVTMDGMLTAIELDVPAEGTQDLQTLAMVFEQTIGRFLGDEYRVDVYQIGESSVNTNRPRNEKGKDSKQNGKKKPDSSKKKDNNEKGPKKDDKNKPDSSKKKGNEKGSRKDDNTKADPSDNKNKSDSSKKKENEKRSNKDDNTKSDSSKKKDSEKRSNRDDNRKSEPSDESESDSSSKKRKQRKGAPRELQAGFGSDQGWAEWDTSSWEKNDVTTWGPGLTECPVDSTTVPVFFELKVIRPCFNCNDEKAFAKGAETFRETFAVLDEAVQSGDMSRSFCMNALRAGVVTTYPCEVSITCVMGISFYDQYLDEIMNSPPPTPLYTYEPSKFPFAFFCLFTAIIYSPISPFIQHLTRQENFPPLIRHNIQHNIPH